MEAPVVTILCYHTFDSAAKTPFTVAHARFDEQLRYLYVQKIPVIPLSQLTDYLQGKAALPPRSVVITIDDGYKTAKEIAWPILQKYGDPFTLYVYPQSISHLRGSLKWDDLRLMAASGVDIESHSMTHPLLTHPGKPMNKNEYHAWIEGELLEPKRRIESELQRPVTSIAYPYGGYDEFIMERTKAAGYLTATTCDDGDVASYTDPMKLNRRLVFPQTTMKAFTQNIMSPPIQMADLSPRDGERVKKIPAEIQARIVNIDSIQPETARLLVDKAGGHWRPVKVDAKTGILSYPLPNATRTGYYYVSLSAKDKTDIRVRHETTWLFIVRRNASKK